MTPMKFNGSMTILLAYRLDDNTARVSARLHLEDLAEHLSCELTDEEREDVDTVGGYMAKILGRVPIPGSTVTLHGWQITAERIVGRRHRIGTVLVTRNESAEVIRESL